jgi:trehalose 6-phosphate synthase
MRIGLRLIISLILVLSLVSLGFSYFQVRAEKRRMRDDLERRTADLAESLRENVEPYLERRSQRDLQRFVERFGNRQHLMGVAVYDREGKLLAATPGLRDRLKERPAIAGQALANDGAGAFSRLDGKAIHQYVLPLGHGDQEGAVLAIIQDASFIEAQKIQIWRQTFFRTLVQIFLIGLTTLLVVRWSIVGPIAKAAQWMRAMRTGKAWPRSVPPDVDLLRPLTKEMASFAESLKAAREAAEMEAQLREAGESHWTPERLSVHVRTKLEESRLFVVSNREPYMHTRRGKTIEVVVPPSGLVTALEPVLRACDGTWVAHGSGDADRETVDRRDSLRVPPDENRYTLRRVWLDKEEEEGYYFGFSNEGLWPLCHIAHTRPIFRSSDFEHYRGANRKFADAVLEEMEGTRKPVLLAQDYHFTLLPRLVKNERPDARVAIFWHIPWPNPEAFGICPWQRELLDGLLGADLIGFHIQNHCNNFLETVDRSLEAHVDWEHFAVTRKGHRTLVRPFPISVDFTESAAPHGDEESTYIDRVALLRELGVQASYMGVGVDRVDYTKGILERFLSVERLLEKYPTYLGQFTFVQIGAPSRTHIKRYHDFLSEVEAEAERINWRFQSSSWKPIVFLKRQHTHHEIQRYYRTADLCLVTSLHDGMNLVAKEFIAARPDEQGSLILSRFTGAARELPDALIVNPYDIDQMAEAIHKALTMSPEERRSRMHRMRKAVREHNVYGWAAGLIGELCEVRLDKGSDRTEDRVVRARGSGV